MRKVILALPVAALLLAAGILLTELGGAFADSGPTVAVPVAPVESAATSTIPAQPCWTETGPRKITGK
ncbi:MAG: hypothetical protein K8U57_03145 [Planctomycetes bacterium]|nr:hypothetical protein [Planctomycetota bacterium]